MNHFLFLQFRALGLVPRRIDVCERIIREGDEQVRAIGIVGGIRADPSHQPRSVVTSAVIAQPAFLVPLEPIVAIALAPEAPEARLAVREVFLAIHEGRGRRTVTTTHDHRAAAEVVAEVILDTGPVISRMGRTDAPDSDASAPVHHVKNGVLLRLGGLLPWTVLVNPIHVHRRLDAAPWCRASFITRWPLVS